jgi:hypothetical protein
MGPGWAAGTGRKIEIVEPKLEAGRYVPDRQDEKVVFCGSLRR